MNLQSRSASGAKVAGPESCVASVERRPATRAAIIANVGRTGNPAAIRISDRWPLIPMTGSVDARAIRGILSSGTLRDSNKGSPAGAKEKWRACRTPCTAGCQLDCLAGWAGVDHDFTPSRCQMTADVCPLAVCIRGKFPCTVAGKFEPENRRILLSELL